MLAKVNVTDHSVHDQVLTCGYFKVNAVAVVRVAAVDVEQALCTAAVEGLTRGHKLFPCDADPDVLLLAINEGSGGHAGSISLTPGASLLTLSSGAVTPQRCGEGEVEEATRCEKQ